jgi:hypothetical protein
MIQILPRRYSMNLFCKIQSTNAFAEIFIFVVRLTCFHGAIVSRGPGTLRYRGFTITLRQTTLDRTPLCELSVRRRGLYLTKNNNHKRQKSVFPAGFEPTVPASKQPQTHALDRAATGTGDDNHIKYEYNMWVNFMDLCGKIK